jgi:hypothetical protein
MVGSKRGREGVAAIEFALIFPFVLALLLPTEELVVGMRNYISAYQALRAAAAYGTYHPPGDVTNPLADNWPTTMTGLFTGSSKSATVLCGNPGKTCTTTSSPLPRYFVLSTTIVPDSSAVVLTSLISPRVVTYTGRFQ